MNNSAFPIVSVVIPCRNDEAYISQCLDSILHGTFPVGDLEVIVVDGQSGEGMKRIYATYAQQYPGAFRVLDNPKKITPVALNIGIRGARGKFIMLMSAHAALAPDAIEKCVKYADQYGAQNVGGLWIVAAREKGWFSQGVALALSHPFGVGSAYYRFASLKEPKWVDTAAYGCYRREVFEEIGLFNERLVHSQDIEFNLRLKKAGGKTLLAPDVKITYFARSRFFPFIKHNVRNGLWAVLPFIHTTIVPVSWRHLVPLFFVSALLGGVGLGLFFKFWAFFFVIVVSYGTAVMINAGDIARRERSGGTFLVMLTVFPVLHVSYGVGSVWGLLQVLAIMVNPLTLFHGIRGGKARA